QLKARRQHTPDGFARRWLHPWRSARSSAKKTCMTISPLIPAATVIPMRDRPGGPPELLLLRRSAGMNFAASAWTFPGGRIDPGDGIATQNDLDAEDAAARVGAIRETIEEAGVAIGLAPSPPAQS